MRRWAFLHKRILPFRSKTTQIQRGPSSASSKDDDVNLWFSRIDGFLSEYLRRAGTARALCRVLDRAQWPPRIGPQNAVPWRSLECAVNVPEKLGVALGTTPPHPQQLLPPWLNSCFANFYTAWATYKETDHEQSQATASALLSQAVHLKGHQAQGLPPGVHNQIQNMMQPTQTKTE